MDKGLFHFSPSSGADPRILRASQWLAPLAFFTFGYNALFDFINQYYPMAILGGSLALLSPISFLISLKTRFHKAVVLYTISASMSIIIMVGLTKLDRTEHFPWIILIPFVLMFFTSRLVGSFLCGIAILILVFSYMAWPVFSANSPIELDAFLSLIAAFTCATIFAALYESNRIEVESALRNQTRVDASASTAPAPSPRTRQKV